MKKLDTILAECDALSKRFDSAVSRRRSRSDAQATAYDLPDGSSVKVVQLSDGSYELDVSNRYGMVAKNKAELDEKLKKLKAKGPAGWERKDSARKDADPEHTVKITYSGDFNMAGLIQHMHRLGSVGASRTIKAVDENDKEVPFGWDGDGADKIHSAEIDGADVLASRKDADDREWRIYVGSKSEGEAMTVRNFSGPESKKTENELRAKAYFEKERLAGKKVGMAAGYFTLPGALKLYIYKTSPF